MSEPIISVEKVSKRYLIGHQTARQDGLRHALQNLLLAPQQWLRNRREHRQAAHEEFWALKDVSFELHQGEVLGIVGRNGAGKSTLLKILSRITEPTSGRIVIDGRVASLLEVGTGFHQELTGRENIFLNGAILGMTKAEIKRKFDEIVAFSEVEQFLDTPVKRYSSGMYVRLAFAVAAHLEPEILIVDEVLAVGDGQFQQKCLGKMQAVAKGGRTVIFVSHNLSTIKTLCQTGLLLDRGSVVMKDTPVAVIGRYLSISNRNSGRWVRPSNGQPSPGISFKTAFFTNDLGQEIADFDFQSRIHLHLEAESNDKYENVQFAVRVTNQEGIPVFTTCNTDQELRFPTLEPGTIRYRIPIDSSLLAPGRYTLKIAAHIPKRRLFDLIDDQLAFEIHDTGSHEQLLGDERLGVLNIIIPWKKLSS